MTDKSADPIRTQSSLPLFDDPMSAVIPASAQTSSARTSQAQTAERVQVQIPAWEAHSVNAHLLEARRLARRMRRLRNQREEQTRTGQAICHHLKAMLTESRPRS